MKITDIIAQQGIILSAQFAPSATPDADGRVAEIVKSLAGAPLSFLTIGRQPGEAAMMSTARTAAAIQKQTGITVVPHLTCEASGQATLGPLLDYLRSNNLENILALRGDPDPARYGAAAAKDEPRPCYASDIVKATAGCGSFCIGVAVHPEGHPDSANLGVDTARVKNKVEAGAQFAISQAFFENFHFYDMMDRFEQDGIRIPVIAGVMPITNFEAIESFAEAAGIEVPVPVTTAFEDLDDPKDVIKAGIDYCVQQCTDLWGNGIRCFHIRTLDHEEVAIEVLRSLKMLAQA